MRISGAIATFGLDDNVHSIPASQSIEISDVSSGVHAWAAVWKNSLGISSIDSGGIDIQGDVTIRITASGVRM